MNNDDSEQSAIYAADALIRRGIPPEDPRFQTAVEAYGTEIIDQYLERASAYMSDQHVEGFKQHDGVEQDGPNYPAAATAFGNMFSLFPTAQEPTTIEEPAVEAGMFEIEALEWHDLIEDGYNTATEHGALVDKYDEMNENGERRPAQRILKDSGWDEVRRYLHIVEDNLVDEAISKERNLPSYAEEKTEFYKYHTAANESDPETIDDKTKQEYREKAANHAEQALRGLYGQFVHPDNTETWNALDHLYRSAIQTHDEHGPMEHAVNRITMQTFHRIVLYHRIQNAFRDSQ